MATTVCLFLTVTFGPILQAESNGQHGIIFKELRSKRIPPQVIALLQVWEGKNNQLPTQFLSVCACVITNLCPIL